MDTEETVERPPHPPSQQSNPKAQLARIALVLPRAVKYLRPRDSKKQELDMAACHTDHPKKWAHAERIAIQTKSKFMERVDEVQAATIEIVFWLPQPRQGWKLHHRLRGRLQEWELVYETALLCE